MQITLELRIGTRSHKSYLRADGSKLLKSKRQNVRS
jgi:hypothetical protein